MEPVITKLIHPHKRFLLCVVIAGIAIGILSRSKGSVQGTTTTLTPSEIISVTNAARQTAGLPPVHPAPQLTTAAQAKATAMFAANAWSHDTPSATPWQFIADTGYQYSVAGENLARNYATATAVVEAWLASPSHRDNLLNPKYTDIGVAVETGNFPDKPNSVLVVQYFATKYDTSSSDPDPTHFSNGPLLSSSKANLFPFGLTFSIAVIVIVAFTLGVWARNIHHRHQLNKQLPSISHWHK